MENKNVSQEQLNEMMREMQKKMLQLDATVVKTPWMVKAILVFLPAIAISFSTLLGFAYIDGSGEWWYLIAIAFIIIMNIIMIRNLKKYDRISDDSIKKIEKELSLFKTFGKLTIGLVAVLILLKSVLGINNIDGYFLPLITCLGIPFLELLIQYPILKSEKNKILNLRTKIDGLK